MLGFFMLMAAVAPDELPSEKMRAREPVLTIGSEKSASDLQQCVGLALSDIGRPIATKAGDQRYVTFGSVAKSPVLITIYDGETRRLEARTSFVLNKKWRNRIRFCAS